LKFWELTSVCRNEPHLLERLADNPEWSIFLEWNRSINELVDRQDREKLDAEVPHEAVLHVLEASRATTTCRRATSGSEGWAPTTRCCPRWRLCGCTAAATWRK
jgi:hypothetical protein